MAKGEDVDKLIPGLRADQKDILRDEANGLVTGRDNTMLSRKGRQVAEMVSAMGIRGSVPLNVVDSLQQLTGLGLTSVQLKAMGKEELTQAAFDIGIALVAVGIDNLAEARQLATVNSFWQARSSQRTPSPGDEVHARLVSLKEIWLETKLAPHQLTLKIAQEAGVDLNDPILKAIKTKLGDSVDQLSENIQAQRFRMQTMDEDLQHESTLVQLGNIFKRRAEFKKLSSLTQEYEKKTNVTVRDLEEMRTVAAGGAGSPTPLPSLFQFAQIVGFYPQVNRIADQEKAQQYYQFLAKQLGDDMKDVPIETLAALANNPEGTAAFLVTKGRSDDDKGPMKQAEKLIDRQAKVSRANLIGIEEYLYANPHEQKNFMFGNRLRKLMELTAGSENDVFSFGSVRKVLGDELAFKTSPRLLMPADKVLKEADKRFGDDPYLKRIFIQLLTGREDVDLEKLTKVPAIIESIVKIANPDEEFSDEKSPDNKAKDMIKKLIDRTRNNSLLEAVEAFDHINQFAEGYQKFTVEYQRYFDTEKKEALADNDYRAYFSYKAGKELYRQKAVEFLFQGLPAREAVEGVADEKIAQKVDELVNNFAKNKLTLGEKKSIEVVNPRNVADLLQLQKLADQGKWPASLKTIEVLPLTALDRAAGDKALWQVTRDATNRTIVKITLHPMLIERPEILAQIALPVMSDTSNPVAKQAGQLVKLLKGKKEILKPVRVRQMAGAAPLSFVIEQDVPKSALFSKDVTITGHNRLDQLVRAMPSQTEKLDAALAQDALDIVTQFNGLGAAAPKDQEETIQQFAKLVQNEKKTEEEKAKAKKEETAQKDKPVTDDSQTVALGKTFGLMYQGFKEASRGKRLFEMRPLFDDMMTKIVAKPNIPFTEKLGKINVPGINLGAMHLSSKMAIPVMAGAVTALFFGLPLTTVVGVGAAFAGMSVGSVVLHELGHGFAAARHGHKPGEIEIGYKGSITLNRGSSARARFNIAFAGPLTNFALAGLAAGIFALAGMPILGAYAGLKVTIPLLHWVIPINFITINLGIGLLNSLFPVSPQFDSFHMARAWLMKRGKSYEEATEALPGGRAELEREREKEPWKEDELSANIIPGVADLLNLVKKIYREKIAEKQQEKIKLKFDAQF